MKGFRAKSFGTSRRPHFRIPDGLSFHGGYMNNLNYVLVEGIVTRDPQVKSVSTTTAVVCSFVMAVNRYYKKKGGENFISDTAYLLVETWGDLARQTGSTLTKGSRIRVVGRLKQSRWNEAGNQSKPRERTYIMAEHIEVGSYKRAEEPTVLKTSQPQAEEPGEVKKQLDQEVSSTVIPEERKATDSTPVDVAALTPEVAAEPVQEAAQEEPSTQTDLSSNIERNQAENSPVSEN